MKWMIEDLKTSWANMDRMSRAVTVGSVAFAVTSIVLALLVLAAT
jgi:flagellar biosynthesis/type III secretory pathway M-ring protein FliF/YscJ